jgi:hypothetical protein
MSQRGHDPRKPLPKLRRDARAGIRHGNLQEVLSLRCCILPGRPRLTIWLLRGYTYQWTPAVIAASLFSTIDWQGRARVDLNGNHFVVERLEERALLVNFLLIDSGWVLNYGDSPNPVKLS